MERIHCQFNDEWKFFKGNIDVQYAIKAGRTGGLTDIGRSRDGEWTQIAYNDKEEKITISEEAWESVTLPHDWVVYGDFSKEEWDAQGYLPTGVGCYRKVFEIPEEYEGRHIEIEFDGISRNATVWLNGHLIGSHFSGYTSFSYDISDYLRYGGERKNVIFIKADARDFEGWWYEGAGIYRHVWLTVTDKLRVEKWGTFITTPEVGETAVVRIETNLVNDNEYGENAELVTEIYTPDGSKAGEIVSPFEILPSDKATVVQTVNVNSPRRWDIDTPNLYTAKTKIVKDGETVDTYETIFGIRTIEFTKEGFFLNGRHVLIKGTCNHQDFAGIGSALPDSINEYKIKKLKEMGSNAYRSSHHPATESLLDACDRLGMLVMDENRKLDSTPRGIEDLKALLYRDRNHPSVIMWCLDNEEVILGTKTGKRIETTLRRLTHKIDPTRPTTIAMNHGWNENDYEDCVDVMGYNYGQRGEQYINDIRDYPERLMICSESTSSTTTRGIYADDNERGYCTSYETNLASWCCTHEKSWKDLLANPRLTGIFVWTGFDYRGEPTPYAWPCINSHFGIMDTCGFPKDAYYYYKAIWTDEPTIHFFPHWNLKKEGEEVCVRIVGNCDTVELILNGRSLGERELDKTGHIDWLVRYEKGSLKAVGKNNGTAVCEQTAVTAGAPAKIRLETDRAMLRDGRDAVVVRASVHDKDGNIVPYADTEINFSVSDGAKIIGVGNGNPSSHEPDKSTKRRAFNGYCAAVVQSTGAKAGAITFKADGLGVDGAELEI